MNQSEEPTGAPEGPQDVRVTRETGVCDVCKVAGGQVVISYDPRVFEGRACPDCILAGKASETFPPDHPAMNPIVFVARAIRGDQPFRDLLKAAEIQRDNPEAAALVRAKMRRKMAPVAISVQNRKARRAAAAKKRKGDS